MVMIRIMVMVGVRVGVRVRAKCNPINNSGENRGQVYGKDDEEKGTTTIRQRKDRKRKIRRLGKRQRQWHEGEGNKATRLRF